MIFFANKISKIARNIRIISKNETLERGIEYG